MSSPVGIVHHLVKRAKPAHDDSWADRLHYVFAPSVLLFLATLHGLRQYFGETIQCFPPAEMARGDWMKYVEGLCFVENTYFVASNEQIPRSGLEREQREIHYYQWVPFLLAGQALFFLLPKLLWKAFNGHTGLDFGSLLDRCYALDKCGDEEEEARTEIGKQLNRHINFEKEKQNRRNSSSWTLVANNEATLLYLGFKMLNLFVTFGQLYFLNQVKTSFF